MWLLVVVMMGTESTSLILGQEHCQRSAELITQRIDGAHAYCQEVDQDA